jgi:peptidoglycan/xylan/chitin deacetylase (PgdA/CDA1 family)
MKNGIPLYFIILMVLTGCHSKPEAVKKPDIIQTIQKKLKPKSTFKDATPILDKKEVPILCYHHIKEILPGDSEYRKTYTVTPAHFEAQMKTLSEQGFQTVSPDDLYNYLVYDTKLPKKPVMITFDDTHEEQYRLGASTMEQYGFKGVFFIMTVSLNRPRYMTATQIVALSEKGHAIEAHSWDHHRVTKYTGKDWDIQLLKPKKQLETLTGKPVHHFAYPFGLWNTEAINELKKRDYRLGFILATKRDTANPLYTVRRMLVPGNWSAEGMLKAMETTFNKKN